MNITGDRGDIASALQNAWILLDEASQVLLRAESIVVLLAVEADASVHHGYAADVASELLNKLKEKLSQAQQIVRPLRRLEVHQPTADA